MNHQQPIYHRNSYARFWVILLIGLISYSCYTKKLGPNQYLLDKNKVIVNDKQIDQDQLTPIIKQRPNKKILGVLKFHLLLHNIPDSAKVEEKKRKKLARKNKKIRRKNIRRKRKEQDTIPLKKLSEISTFGEKLLYSIGEPPVIVDTNQVHRTSKQMSIYLVKKGFFNNSVKDSIAYIDKQLFKRNRAKVYYKVILNQPYRIKSFAYTSSDTALLRVLSPLIKKKNIKAGEIFDIPKLNQERDDITNLLLNKGYYRFNKTHIKFLIDSNISGKMVNIKLQISDANKNNNSLNISPHRTYNIGKIEVRYIQNEQSIEETTFDQKNISFYIQGKNDVRTNLFHNALVLKPGDIYNKQLEQKTFKNFTNYGLFKTVNIKTEVITIAKVEVLKMTVSLRENKKQQFRIDGNITNSGGSNFGLETNTSYAHKNFFRGAEVFKVGFNGTIEYLQQFTNDDGTDNSNIPLDVQSFSNISSAFNTIEFGPEASFTFPKLLFINTNKFPNVNFPKTKISTSLNYQRRINQEVFDYERGTQEAIISYAWGYKKKFAHLIEPIAYSAIEVRKSDEFQQRIDLLNDKLLAASFQNHIISASRYRFTYNELQGDKKKKRNLFYSGSLEAAGNSLRAFYELTNQPQNSSGNYDIFGIQFAQYVKTSHDLRLYYEINDKNSFVTRLNTGLGIPLTNLNDALPFVKSFFSGGADKIRAWKARSLGPGSFRDSAVTFDKIGEILIEGNIEYRFDLIGFLDAALFVDAGNIWLLNEDSLRPGSQFNLDEFYKEIAIGAGFGIRIDLDFFLLRFDFGFPLKNPTLIEGERWFYQKKDEYNAWKNNLSDPSQVPTLYAPQFNIGIGFPF